MEGGTEHKYLVAGYQMESSVLGSGCTGKVYRTTRISDGSPCVIKFFHSLSIDRVLMKILFQRLQEAPQHANMVPILDFHLEDAPYYLISRHEEGCPINQCPPVSEFEAWTIIGQLISSLGHAHKFGVVHGNLHPGNLFWETRLSEVRINDFGSGVLGHFHHIDLKEAAYFAPPEQLLCLGRDYGEGKAERWDVYRFGAVAYWLLNHRIPRGHAYQKNRARDIVSSGGRPVPIDPNALGESMFMEKKLNWFRRLGSGPKERFFRVLIDRCLDLDPSKRPVDMREVQEQTDRFRRELEYQESSARAAEAVALAESQIRWERNKQKAKLFSARALATMLAASCLIATFYLLTFFEEKKQASAQVRELDSVVANQKAHISLLDEVVEDGKVDLKESREAADASFYHMTQVSAKTSAANSTTVAKDLEKARVYYERILFEVSNKPNAFLERGRALHSLAHIEKKMSRLEAAFLHFGDAVSTLETALQITAQDQEEQRQDLLMRLADCHENLGRMHPLTESEAAMSSIQQAIILFRKILAAHPGDSLATLRLAENSYLLGNALKSLDHPAGAVDAYAEAAGEMIKLRELSSENLKQNDLDRMVARLQFNGAEVLGSMGRKEEAVDAYIATIESIERFRGFEGYTRKDALVMARSFLALGDIFGEAIEISSGDRDQVYNEALRLLTPLNRQDSRDFEVASLMAATLIRLARLDLVGQKRGDALPLTVQAIEVLKAVLDNHPENLEGLLQLTETRLDHLGMIRNHTATSREASLRGVATATRAHEIFLSRAPTMRAKEKSRIENQLRRLFAAFGEICSQLGQSEAASKCQSYLALKLEYQN